MMQVYVRLGIRLLIKGSWKADGFVILPGLLSYFFTVDLFVARRLLISLSIKQGIKYDAPESAADITPFIAFHGLNVDEILDPPDSFSTLVNISLKAISDNILTSD